MELVETVSSSKEQRNGCSSHGVFLEELLKLLLGGRVSEVPDIQATALIRTGGRSIGGLRSGGSGAVGVGGFVDGGRSHVVSQIVDGRHLGG